MKINSAAKGVKIDGENGSSFELRYTNMGEPYRDGAAFSLQDEYDGKFMSGFFQKRELVKMRDFLNSLLPVDEPTKDRHKL